MAIFGKLFTDIMSEVRVMIDALNRVGSTADDFPMGLGSTFIDEITASREKALAYNTEIEELKAELTAKNVQLDDEMKKVKKLYSEAKDKVKEGVPQEGWSVFGITDKK